MTTIDLKFILCYLSVVKDCSFVQYIAFAITYDEDMKIYSLAIPIDFKIMGACVLVQVIHFDHPSLPYGSPTPPVQSNTSMLMQSDTCVDNDFTFSLPSNLSISNNVLFNPYSVILAILRPIMGSPSIGSPHNNFISCNIIATTLYER